MEKTILKKNKVSLLQTLTLQTYYNDIVFETVLNWKSHIDQRKKKKGPKKDTLIKVQ